MPKILKLFSQKICNNPCGKLGIWPVSPFICKLCCLGRTNKVSKVIFFRVHNRMRRTPGPSQRPISGLLPIPISLNATLRHQPAIQQLLGSHASDDHLQPKAKVPAFSTPKLKAQPLPNKISEAGEQQTVGNHSSNLGNSSLLSEEPFSPHFQSEAVALTKKPHFSTPSVNASNPLVSSSRLSGFPETVSSPSGEPLGGGKHPLAECSTKDEHQPFRSFDIGWRK